MKISLRTDLWWLFLTTFPFFKVCSSSWAHWSVIQDILPEFAAVLCWLPSSVQACHSLEYRQQWACGWLCRWFQVGEAAFFQVGSQPVRLSYGNMISVPSSLNENFCSSGFPLLPVFVPVKQSSFSFTEWIAMCRPSRSTFQIPHWFPLPEGCFVILVGVTYSICITSCLLPWWIWANLCLDKMWRNST